MLLFFSKIAEGLRFESIGHSNTSFVNNFINCYFVAADALVIPCVTTVGGQPVRLYLVSDVILLGRATVGESTHDGELVNHK
jgi:hypothetical protein